MQLYEYQHVISFSETNLVGNVYYVNYLSWQGRCREMFLRDRAPDILTQLDRGLALATVKVSCEYFSELFAFDKVSIRMRLGAIAQNRITMLFEYYKITDTEEKLVAKGEQQVACLKRVGDSPTETLCDRTVPIPIPESLLEALQPYL